jgi:hypothetical protein
LIPVFRQLERSKEMIVDGEDAELMEDSGGRLKKWTMFVGVRETWRE